MPSVYDIPSVYHDEEGHALVLTVRDDPDRSVLRIFAPAPLTMVSNDLGGDELREVGGQPVDMPAIYYSRGEDRPVQIMQYGESREFLGNAAKPSLYVSNVSGGLRIEEEHKAIEEDN